MNGVTGIVAAGFVLVARAFRDEGMDVCFYKATVPVFINVCVSPVLSIVPAAARLGGGR